MGIHLWIVGIIFMMTSVVALTHCTDNMDVGTATGDHPDPRGDATKELQHLVRGNVTREQHLNSSEEPGDIVCSPEPRSLKADVVFLLDTSKYMTEEKFTKAKDFMKAFAGEFDIGPSRLNLGVITYDRTAHTQFWLNNYTTNTSLFAAIDRINFTTGGQHPFLVPPLTRAREDAFTEANGDREDVPNILIMLGDGRAVDSGSVKKEKAELNKTDIRIYCLGFYQIITPTMMAIASKYENNFRITCLKDLDSVLIQLTKAVSEEIAAFSPPKRTGTFSVTTHVSNVSYSGTIDWYYIIVQFESRKTWGKSFRISPNAGFFADTDYPYDHDAVYYGIYDQIRHVIVYKNFGSDTFFPEYFTVDGPGECDRYVCNWKKECMKEDAAPDKMYEDCFLGKEDAVAVPCKLANTVEHCAKLYE